MAYKSKRRRNRYDKWYMAGYRSYRTTEEALAVYREIKDRTGMRDAAIAEAADLNPKWIGNLKTGKYQRVQGAPYRRLVALRDSSPAPVRVPVVGAQRRLRGLMRMGYGVPHIKAHLGFQTHHLHRREPTYLIKYELHQKIVALYDELSMIPGPSSSARVRAEHKGWPPPLAWDDDTIDDPAAKPNLTGGHRQAPGYIDHAKVVRRLRGEKGLHINKYEAEEVARTLRARGVTGYAQEHTYGLKPERYGEAS